MTNSASHERMIAVPSSTSRDRARISPAIASQPLPAAEIESLLRMARENLNQPRPETHDEEFGPGDVQHLRGDSMTHPGSTIAAALEPSWSDSSRDPDTLLQHAERHLAEAILDSGGSQASSAPAASEFARNAVQDSREAASRQGLTLEDLGNVDLDITIELGRTEILIEDILKLREGSVVSLDKLAGDPVDIVANGRLVARGELLVIDGKFGVRLSEVL